MNLQQGKFTVFALTYGNHTKLARRCFQSIADRVDPSRVDSIRIGFNAVTDETLLAARDIFADCPVPVLGYNPGTNVMKYPLMRKMFYDPDHPVKTEYVMWFDDDSCIAAHAGQEFFSHVDLKMRADKATLLGDLWIMRFVGNQKKNISKQLWYTGKPWHRQHNTDVMKFATGGWWTARFDVLRKWDYPWPALRHNGGDTTLGEMLRQQDLNLVSYKTHLWINADDTGKPSSAPRRGVNEGNRPVWYDDLTVGNQHDFKVKAYRLDTVASELTPVRIPGL
jgi:hypothetical protein